jgi:FkbM family methyltransferase
MSFIKPSLRQRVKGVVLKTDQGWYCLDPDDQFVSKNILDTGAYGLAEIERAKQFFGNDSRLLVVGAHIGTIAIPLSKLCRELVAIEANPATYEFLELNVLMNRCGNLKTYNVAANNQDEMIPFIMSTDNSAGSKRMPLIRDFAYFYDSPQITSVRGARLDDLLDNHEFDLVFMDIEGSEYFALTGMQKILGRARTLIVEFLPHHLSKVAGISVSQFLEPIAGHFSSLTVPSTRVRVGAEGFLEALQAMYDKNRRDDGIIFQK